MRFDVESVRARLPGRDIRWFDTIDSTMHEAARLAARGAASGTMVGAEEQTAGLGRHGHSWHSEREAGLYLSLVLRLPLPLDSLPLVTLTLGLAAAEAISQVCGIACDLRWPNDVLTGGKKCAGILVQFEQPAVVAGIGINVNHAGFPEDIAALATSLHIASGRTQSREDLLVRLLESIDAHCRILTEQGKEAILQSFTYASSFVSGRRVIVEQSGEALEGITEGLNDSGFLLLRRRDGKQSVILAGGVRPA
jgi:BirA family biotin operon repressor/biotin-[acetyl-CoA-carboxylase] ligase